jgi:hypothetical protein
MRIIEYHSWSFFLGLVASYLFTRWQMSTPQALIGQVERLVSDVRSRVETLAVALGLKPTQVQRIISGSSLLDLDELFDFYQWALMHRFDHTNDEPLIKSWVDPKSKLKKRKYAVDPTELSSLAVICEKQLGLTRVDALYLLLRAKQGDDYKLLLSSILKARQSREPS